MNEETFLQVQAIELQRMLDNSANDPILGPQLRERLDEMKQVLQAVRQQPGTLFPKETPVLPRAAIFFRGEGVQGSEGIRPSLAGEALIQYEKMFTEQAIHDERIAAKNAGRQRRPRGAPTPGLLFTGTPRGSFGLEFVPLFQDDDSLMDVHSQSLVNIAKSLTRVVESDAASLDEVVSGIPPRVLQPLKQFLKTLAQHDAELRFAFQDGPAKSLSASQLKSADELLERDVEQKTIMVPGVFRGLTWETGVFDLRMNDDSVITGTVADAFTEEDLGRIDSLTNRQCVAELQKTIVRRIGGAETPTYVLLDARSAEPSSQTTD
jgi:hypothetical protein